MDRMFLLIPFFPRHADDLVWIRVWAALRCIRTVGKELVTSHALGNGITINRRESRRGCESSTRWMDIRERNRVRNRAEPRRKRATPFFYPSIRPSIRPSIFSFFTLSLSHRLSRNSPRTRQCKSRDIAIKKLSRSSREQRPLLFPRVQRGRRGIRSYDN